MEQDSSGRWVIKLTMGPLLWARIQSDRSPDFKKGDWTPGRVHTERRRTKGSSRGIRVKHLQAEEHRRWLAGHQVLESCEDRFPQVPWGESSVGSLVLDFSHPEQGRCFLSFKSLVCGTVVAALGFRLLTTTAWYCISTDQPGWGRL